MVAPLTGSGSTAPAASKEGSGASTIPGRTAQALSSEEGRNVLTNFISGGVETATDIFHHVKPAGRSAVGTIVSGASDSVSGLAVGFTILNWPETSRDLAEGFRGLTSMAWWSGDADSKAKSLDATIKGVDALENVGMGVGQATKLVDRAVRGTMAYRAASATLAKHAPELASGAARTAAAKIAYRALQSGGAEAAQKAALPVAEKVAEKVATRVATQAAAKGLGRLAAGVVPGIGVAVAALDVANAVATQNNPKAGTGEKVCAWVTAGASTVAAATAFIPGVGSAVGLLSSGIAIGASVLGSWFSSNRGG